MAEHIEGLARELKCMICLGVMTAPVCRTPCSHYFCKECISESVRHKPQCPVCKSRVSRRDLKEDEMMARVVHAFARVEELREEIIGGGSSQLSPAEEDSQQAHAWQEQGGEGGAATAAGAAPCGSAGPAAEVAPEEEPPAATPAGVLGGICWLQGDPDYKSPSVTASELAELRRRRRLSIPSARTSPDAPPVAAAERAPEAAAGAAAPAGAAGAPAPAGAEEAPPARRQQHGGTALPCRPQRQQREGKENARRQQAQAEQQPQPTHQGPIDKGAEPTEAKAQQASGGGAGRGARGPAPAAAAGARGAASLGSPPGASPGGAGVDLILQGLSDAEEEEKEEEGARPAGAAGQQRDPTTDDHAGSGVEPGSEGQLTPPPAQAAAPRTAKVAAAAGPAAAASGGRAAPASAPAAAAASDRGRPGSGAGRRRGSTSSGQRRKRAETPAAGGERGPGSAPAGGGGGKRSRRGAAAPPWAGPVPGSGRRIPTRLLPWNCSACTFQNAGSAAKCEMCSSSKRAIPVVELTAERGPAAAAGAPAAPREGPPAAVAALAAVAAQQVGPPAPAATAAAAAGAAASGGGGWSSKATGQQPPPPQQQPAGGAKKQRQRKMSGGAGAGSSKRQRAADGRRPSAPYPAAAPAPPAAAPAPDAELLSPALRGRTPDSAPRSGGGDAAAAAGAAPPPPWRASRHHPCASWVLLGSGLGPEGREALRRLAAAAGARVVSKWSDRVTHVVCGVADGAARRTFKYLRGILSDAWVLGEPWLAACLQRGAPAEEAPFQVVRDASGSEGGAAASRAHRKMGLPSLLDGYEIYLAGAFSSRDEVAALLRAAGSRELKRLPPAPPPGAEGPCTSFVLCEETAAAGSTHAQHGSGGAEEARWRDKAAAAGVPVVAHRWLLDSVSSWTAKPLQAYRLDAAGDGSD